MGPDGNLILVGMQIYDQSELLTRDSVVAVIESKPCDWIHSKIDLSLSYYHDDQILRGMEIPMAYTYNSYGAVPLPGYTVTNGLVTNYTITQVNPVVRNMDTLWTAHMKSVIWNLDLGEKTTWPAHFSAGWSSAEKRGEVLETYAGLGFNNTETDGDTLVVSDPAGPNPPHVISSTDYANASLISLTDPQGYGTYFFPVTGQEGYLKYFQSYDVADSFKALMTHELNTSVIKDMEVGISYSGRFKQFGQNPSGFLVNADGNPQAPLPPLVGTTDLSWIGNLHPIAFDAVAALNSGRYTFVPNAQLGAFYGDNYKIWENVTRPLVKFDLNGKVDGVPFDGNLGAVADFASQYSTGLSGDGGNTVTPVSGGARYADFLPTLNLTFKPTQQDFIRFFVGREEQRPDMYAMRAARNYAYDPTLSQSTTVSPWSATSGNPGLKPWIADAIDIDFEHYFPKGNGYLSLALYEKKLLTYIYQQLTVESFAGYPYTSALPPILTEGVASQFVNGQGGYIGGAEGTVQVTSDVLTGGALPGFGVNLNAGLLDSNIQQWGPNAPTAPLNDMSKRSATLTLFYESHGFSARVSDHYQSETREYIITFGVPTFNALGTPYDGYSEEIPYHTISAQVSYAFRSGVLRGLTIYIEGSNLNDAPQITYFGGDPRQLWNWQKYGASYRSGATYRF